ncbi:hypothetical protein C8Q78DRAFT_475327 [Trametes maxima]|nr:hypothetical protein C8Q78DRAFT_475327 [Trametes maxima]
MGEALWPRGLLRVGGLRRTSLDIQSLCGRGDFIIIGRARARFAPPWCCTLPPRVAPYDSDSAAGSFVNMDSSELPPYATLSDAIEDLEAQALEQSQEEFFAAVNAALRGTVDLGSNGGRPVGHDELFWEEQWKPLDSQVEEISQVEEVPWTDQEIPQETYTVCSLPEARSEVEPAPEVDSHQQYSRSPSVLSYLTEESYPSEDESDEDYSETTATTKKRKKGKRPARPRKRLRNSILKAQSPDSHTLRPTQAQASPNTSYIELPGISGPSQAPSASLDVSDSEMGSEKENEDPFSNTDSAGSRTSKSFYVTHGINWKTNPPKWGDKPIKEMPSEEIAGYLICRYKLDGQMVCLWNGCGKTLKNAATCLVNHLNGTTHINRRGNCSGCSGGFSARVDMYKERVKSHVCPGTAKTESEEKGE